MKRVLGYGLTALVIACSGADIVEGLGDASAPQGSDGGPDPAAAPSAALGFGSQGNEVREVYQYLARYGYFPNEELAKKHPGFRPLVADAPKDPNVFGPELAHAVRLYQQNMGLEETGVVDAKTRETMAEPRCPHPDVEIATAEETNPDAPPTAAFDVNENFPKTGYNWMIAANSLIPSTFTRATWGDWVDANIYAKWRGIYDRPLTKVTSGATQQLTFEVWDGPSADTNGDGFCDTACNFGVWANGVLKFDSQEPIAITTWPTASQFDFQTVALHEVGHSIGLGHSADSLAIMYPTVKKGVSRRGVSPDDRQAVRAGLARWGTASGSTGIADAAQSPSHLWGLFTGTNSASFCSISSPGTCLNIGFAVRSFAADSQDRIWAVTSSGAIYYARLSSTSWTQIGGGACANDISINASGLVVVRGCDDRAHYGRMNGAMSDADLFAHRNDGFEFLGAGSTGNMPFFQWVASGATGAPTAWGVDYQGVPWYWLSTVGWTSLDTLVNGQTRIKSISSTADGSAVWAVSFDGTKVLALNLQNRVTYSDGGTAAGERRRWITSASGFTSLQRARVGLDGRPYITQTGGPLRSTTK